MKKKNLKIVKFISFLLLIFSFNLNVNAETTKIYYADSKGIRKFAAEQPAGYPKNEGGATMYSSRSIAGTYKPTLYYECAVNETSDVKVFQTVACDSEESKNPEYKYQKSKTYRCVESSSDLVESSEVIEDYKESDGEACNKYSDWSAYSSTKPEGYDEKKTELYRSLTFYYWYKEVANGTAIDFTNNKVLYDAIKWEISTSQIKDAEINYIEEKDKDGKDTYKILAADISKVTSLDLHEYEIVDITQLGKFTGLTELNLRTNKIVNIDSLKYLVNLETLNLGNNYIVSVEPIVGLKKLKTLSIWTNDITNLSLLKKIENYDSIEKDYTYNDYKKSGLIKNWSDFVREVTFALSDFYSVSSTKDSMEFIYSGKTVAKFEYKNNILKLISFSTDDYDGQDAVFGMLGMSITHSEMDKLDETCKKNDDKCYFSKYGDYLKLNTTYDDNNHVSKMDMSFDLRYFYGDSGSKNPKTGVPNALVLLGITLMSCAIGFVVIYKHKTGIQL